MSVIRNNGRITSEYLKVHLDYNPGTGEFRWKSIRPGRKAGKSAGAVVWPGYVKIKLDDHLYFAHRLAWLYANGEWPDGLIDHIDGNKANNAISNLRIVTSAQNAARRETIRTKSPARGVFPHGPGFVVRIHHAGKRYYLGYHSTLDAAKDAYAEAAKRIHGEFAYQEPVSIPPAAYEASVMNGALGYGA